MEQEQMVQAIMGLQATVAGLGSDIKTVFKRLDEQQRLVETVHSLALSVEKMASKQEIMAVEQQRQRADIDALRMQPAKRWEALVGQVVSVLVAIVIGYFIGTK